VDLEDVDLTPIDPLPSYVWYQDMADFADRISDEAAGRRRALTTESNIAPRPTLICRDARVSSDC
jgi:hypothetical protein